MRRLRVILSILVCIAAATAGSSTAEAQQEVPPELLLEVVGGQPDASAYRDLFGLTETRRWIVGCRDSLGQGGGAFELINPINGIVEYQYLLDSDSYCGGGSTDFKPHASSSNGWIYLATQREVLAFESFELQWKVDLGTESRWQLQLFENNQLFAASVAGHSAGEEVSLLLDAVSGEIVTRSTLPTASFSDRLLRHSDRVAAVQAGALYSWGPSLAVEAILVNSEAIGGTGDAGSWSIISLPDISSKACEVEASFVHSDGSVVYRQIEAPFESCGFWDARATANNGIAVIARNEDQSATYWALANENGGVSSDGVMHDLGGVDNLRVDQSGALIFQGDASDDPCPFDPLAPCDGSRLVVTVAGSEPLIVPSIGRQVSSLVVGDNALLGIVRADCEVPCNRYPIVAFSVPGLMGDFRDRFQASEVVVGDSPNCSERVHTTITWVASTPGEALPACSVLVASSTYEWAVTSAIGGVEFDIETRDVTAVCSAHDPVADVSKFTCTIGADLGPHPFIRIVARDSSGSSHRSYGVRPKQQYVALGDSYSSGFGLGDYEFGTNLDAGENNCQRSDNAYPHWVAFLQEVELSAFRACQGAVTHHFYFEREPGRGWGEFAQLDRITADTELVTFSIGGNDAGFSSVLLDCIDGFELLPTNTCHGDSRIKDPVAERFDRLAGLGDTPTAVVPLAELFSDIRQRAPTAEVVVVGYPSFFPKEGGDRALLIGGRCEGFKKADQRWVAAQISHLNELIALEAAQHGFIFANPQSAFEGHELCSGGTEWFYPALHGGRIHPNQLGHQALGQVVADALDVNSATERREILPGQTIEHSLTVTDASDQLTVAVSWPGSDIELTLLSPSGQEFSRSTPTAPIYERTTTATLDQAVIHGPEAGLWTVRLFGADIEDDGEAYLFWSNATEVRNQNPTASFTTEVVDGTLWLSAEGSFDSDGMIVSSKWIVTSDSDTYEYEGVAVAHPMSDTSSPVEVSLLVEDDRNGLDFLVQSVMPSPGATDPSPTPITSPTPAPTETPIPTSTSAPTVTPAPTVPVQTATSTPVAVSTPRPTIPVITSQTPGPLDVPEASEFTVLSAPLPALADTSPKYEVVPAAIKSPVGGLATTGVSLESRVLLPLLLLALGCTTCGIARMYRQRIKWYDID